MNEFLHTCRDYLPSFEQAMLVLAAWLTWDQFRRNKAATFVQRFNAKDVLVVRAAVDGWLNQHPDNDARLRALDESPELNAQVRLLMNLFQEIGVAYEQGLVHRRETRDYFDVLVVHYWEQLRFVVERARVQQGYTLYRRFERFAGKLAKRRHTDRTVVTYVFAYGSLLQPDSAAKTLGRPVELADYVPVRVQGWTRTWTVADRVRCTGDGREHLARFLDLAPGDGASVAGALIRVTPDELRRLQRRERNYRMEEITADCRVVHGRPLAEGGRRHTRIVTFVGLPAHRVGDGVGVVPQRYLALLERAAQFHGAWLAEEFARTPPPALPRLEGEYTFP